MFNNRPRTESKFQNNSHRFTEMLSFNILAPLGHEQRQRIWNFLEYSFRPSLMEHLKDLCPNGKSFLQDSCRNAALENKPLNVLVMEITYSKLFQSVIHVIHLIAMAEVSRLWDYVTKDPNCTKELIEDPYKSMILVLMWMKRNDLIDQAKVIYHPPEMNK
jgi:hypothetical protein